MTQLQTFPRVLFDFGATTVK